MSDTDTDTHTHMTSYDQRRGYSNAESLSQYPGLTQYETHNFSGFMVPQPESISQPFQPQSRSHLVTVPVITYSDFCGQLYQSGIQDHDQNYSGSIDAHLNSPHEPIESSAFQIQDQQSERVGAPISTAERQGYQTVGDSVAPSKYGDSLDDSRTTSPINSQEFATLGLNRPCVTRMEDDIMAPDGRHDFDRPPPWSELKTKAGKERKRLPLACIACRRRKIRCSGEKPTCKHCQQSRTPCVYRITTRKPAPRIDYMSMLDRRLKRMEERVIKIIPKEDVDQAVATGRANVRSSWSGQGVSQNGKKRFANEAFGHDLDELAHPKTKYLARRGTDLDKKDKFLEGAESLPSKEIQEHLSEVFFEYLYGQSYHLLHKPSFMSRLRAGKVPPVLILAVCAISARFSTHPQVKSEPAFLRGEDWAAPARDIAIRRYDEPDIEILTVLLILGLHEFGTCQGGRSWMLGGMAMRMAYALQLHQELKYDRRWQSNHKESDLTFTDREIRRRTMWACFIMDRFSSSGTERPPFIDEETIEVHLPIKESHFLGGIPGATENLNGNAPKPETPGAGQAPNPNENMGVGSYMIRIIALWGRVVQYVNLGGKERDTYPIWNSQSGFARLKKQADDFQASLPSWLQNNQENLKSHAAEKLANQFVFMHIAFFQVILFLHCFAVPTMPGGKLHNEMPKSFVAEAGRAAIAAASQISLLLGDALAYLVVAPFAGYCAFTSSTVQVWGMFSKNPTLEAASKKNLARNLKYLSKAKKYWGMFHYMGHNLREIYLQHADASLKGLKISETSKPDNSIFQYGDWFQKYPHGVSKTDYEDPATNVKQEPGESAMPSQRSDLQTIEEFFSSLAPPTGTTLPHQYNKAAKKGIKKTSYKISSLALRQSDSKTYPAHLPLKKSPLLSLQLCSNSNPSSVPPSAFNSPQQSPPDFLHPTSDPLLSFQPTTYEHHLLPQLNHDLVYEGSAGSNPSTAVASPSNPSGLAVNMPHNAVYPIYDDPPPPLPPENNHSAVNNTPSDHNLGGATGLSTTWNNRNPTILDCGGNLDGYQQQQQQQAAAMQAAGQYHYPGGLGSDLHTSGWFMPFDLRPPCIAYIPLGPHENIEKSNDELLAGQTGVFSEDFGVDNRGMRRETIYPQ